ncbi:MAG: organomercurial transporter MerC [Halioglobus sp.]
MDKVGVGGVIIAALSCAACFPALGALTATRGLGFLSQLEGLAINKLLPIFASLALAVNAYGWYQHRVHWRGVVAVLGPSAILATLYPLWQYGWSTYLFYSALVLMLAVSFADLIWPAIKVCPVSREAE